MATSALRTEKHRSVEAKIDQLVSSIRFDLIMGLISVWLVSGLYIDGWAHTHGKVDRTFFTPWHVNMYLGIFAAGAFLVGNMLLNHSRGYSWRRSLPASYWLSLFGVPLFFIGGVADLIWHTLFGFEVGIEPLLSPTHLVLALSGVLIMTGPLRATLQRARMLQGWKHLLPMLLSMISTFSGIVFFTDFAHPFTHTWTVTNADADSLKSLGAAGILLETALLMGFVLYMVRRWQLPLGALTLFLTCNAALLSLLGDQYRLIPAAFLAGAIADLLLFFLKPSAKRIDAMRIFAFSVPMVLYLFYFLTLMLTDTITWSIHLWLGSTILAGVVGLLLSFAMVPTQQTAQERE